MIIKFDIMTQSRSLRSLSIDRSIALNKLISNYLLFFLLFGNFYRYSGPDPDYRSPRGADTYRSNERSYSGSREYDRDYQSRDSYSSSSRIMNDYSPRESYGSSSREFVPSSR